MPECDTTEVRRRPAAAIPAVEIADARARYERGDEPLARIAEDLGISIHAFRRLRAREGWPPRGLAARAAGNTPDGARPSGAGEKTASAPAGTAAPVVDPLALCRRVEAAVCEELAAVEQRLKTQGPADAEKNVRVLASLVKSLAELRRLESARAGQSGNLKADSPDVAGHCAGDGDARPPRSLAELREELARRLEVIRAEHSG